MNTLDFTKHLKTKGLTNIYPSNIPTGLSGVTGVYLYSSSIDKYNTFVNAKYQFVVADKDLNICESKANNILDWLLDNSILHDVVEDYEILTLIVLNMPNYIGIDEETRYRFSFNIEIQAKKFKN